MSDGTIGTYLFGFSDSTSGLLLDLVRCSLDLRLRPASQPCDKAKWQKVPRRDAGDRGEEVY